jgi:hypothetical protein
MVTLLSKTVRLTLLLSLTLLLLSASGCGVWKKVFSSDEPASQSSSQADSSQPGGGAAPVTLNVSSRQVQGGVAPVSSLQNASLLTVWVGSFLDPEPAERAADVFRKRGLVSFSVKKTLADRGLVSGVIGDYHLVLVGLFGEKQDADYLGRLLKAQNQVVNWQVISSEAPQEINQAIAQTAPLVEQSYQVTQAAQEKASRPLDPQAPVVTGEAFKKLVRGRFIGSYRDVLEAKKEANRLTSAGWPATVVSNPEDGGMWYRVYLAESADHRDFTPIPHELESAMSSAASQQGMALLIDTSGLKGLWGQKTPNAARTDASACAGYSQSGRLLTSVERLVGYIPDTSLLMVVKPVSYQEPANVLESITRPARTWWNKDDSEITNSKTAFGPAIYNRPEVISRIRALTVNTKSAPISPALNNFPELGAIPGKKTVLLFSEFKSSQDAVQALSALGNLKAQYGDNLNFFVIYGDTDDLGWQMAENLAKSGGTKESWDGCRLVSDNAYFEQFIRSVFKK